MILGRNIFNKSIKYVIRYCNQCKTQISIQWIKIHHNSHFIQPLNEMLSNKITIISGCHLNICGDCLNNKFPKVNN